MIGQWLRQMDARPDTQGFGYLMIFGNVALLVALGVLIAMKLFYGLERPSWIGLALLLPAGNAMLVVIIWFGRWQLSLKERE